MTRAPQEVETPRLLLRRPRAEDAWAIYERYASDREATKYMAWPMHTTINDTYAFLACSDAEWRRWPAGPYIICSRDGELIGSTGYAFETTERAITGYILARDAWGRGYATESLRAMIDVAARIGIRVLTASCHADHGASAHVLEKCGFVQDGRLSGHMVFPNLGSQLPADVLSYSLAIVPANR